MLVTAGERKAISLVSMALNGMGVHAECDTGSQAGFVTDANHSNAKILEVRAERIREAVEAGVVPVVAGAQGVSVDNNVTFLGRGGSDTTAVALAKALEADACELYTDVSGVFTTDPRVVPEARRMHRITFDEMLEMTAAGCPKPAMRSVEYAHRHHVPLHVRSAFTWEPGTWVTEEDPEMEAALIRAVVSDDSEAKVTVAGVPDRPGIAGSRFRHLADAEVTVDMIVQNVSVGGVTDISFTVPHGQLGRAMEICEAERSQMGAAGLSSDEDIAKVSVVGAGMKSNPGVAAVMFETLAANAINIEMISTSAIRISCVVPREHSDRAVQVLHDVYELEDTTF
ncbi:MAG: aspartate kinase [Microthrixaceae bacterium]